MSWRVTPQLKTWLDRAAAESGRSLAQEIELRLEMSRVSEMAETNSYDFVFGRANTGIMLLIGLMLADARRRGAKPWGADPETDAAITAALARAIAVLFGAEIAVPRPASIAERDWEGWVGMCLQPLYGIRDYLASDRRAAGRLLFDQICDRLGEGLCNRIAALPSSDRPPVEDPFALMYARRERSRRGADNGDEPDQP